MYGMNVSLYTTCMYDMSVHTTAHYMFGHITWPTTKRVKVSNYLSYSALTQLGHAFQETRVRYIHLLTAHHI